MRLFCDGVGAAMAQGATDAKTHGVYGVPVTLDLNRARVAELALLPGIGPGRAAAIVLHRVRHGPFARVEDLVAVDGLGPATVARLGQFVECRGPTAGSGAPSAHPERPR